LTVLTFCIDVSMGFNTYIEIEILSGRSITSLAFKDLQDDRKPDNTYHVNEILTTLQPITCQSALRGSELSIST
jgi:hypothetical protein